MTPRPTRFSAVHVIRTFLLRTSRPPLCFFFFFNDTATTEIYTLSLHDALPISRTRRTRTPTAASCRSRRPRRRRREDRKSTRLNSSHVRISYAVFCLKKKKKNTDDNILNVESRQMRLVGRRVHC